MHNTIESANREITRLEIVAKDSENKLRSFFESSSVIHLLIDTEYCVIDFNRAASQFIQKYYRVALKQGILVTSFMHTDHKHTFKQNYIKALSGVPVRAKKKLSYGVESIDWFLSYEPAWDSDGEILGMSFNAIDITEKIANESKILSQYHSLNEIAYIHSHQLRRPISNIMGLMDIFKADGYKKITGEDMLMLQKAVDQLEIQMLLIEAQT